jgi:hypothetical protein
MGTLTLQQGLDSYAGCLDVQIGGGGHSNYEGQGRPMAPYPLTIGPPADLWRVLVRFELPALPEGATLSSATLHLYDFYGTNAGNTIKLHRALTAWTAWFVDWLDAYHGVTAWGAGGGLAGTDYATTPDDTFVTGNSAGWHSFEVTATVSDCLATPAANLGWFVIGDAITGYTVYDSSESTVDAALRPKLVIDYSTGGSPPAGGGDIHRGAIWRCRRG